MKKFIKNIYLAIKDQLTRPGAFRNIFITHNAFGIFSKNSHINQHKGEPKVSYPTREAARKAADSMEKKRGVHFSVYKCLWCDGYHIGKNAQNKIEGYDYPVAQQKIQVEIYGQIREVDPKEVLTIRTPGPKRVPSHLKHALVSWGDSGTPETLAKKYPKIVKIIPYKCMNSLEFRKYSEIENSFNKEFMEKVRFSLAEHNLNGQLFVVQEKVHGSNSSFLVSGREKPLEFGKRTAKVKPGEQFFNYEELLGRYQDRVYQVWDLLLEKHPTLIQAQIYGEFFGGTYPHPDVPVVKGVSHVQKGVYYSPTHEFYGFDIRIWEGDIPDLTAEPGKYLPVEEVNDMLEEAGILWAKTLFVGTLDECLKYPNAFDSKIPEWLGLPSMAEGTNTCEGVVIRPTIPLYLGNGSRLIIKNKNAKFTEKKQAKKANKTPGQPAASQSEALQALLPEAVAYVVEPRLDSVTSKMGEIESWTKSFGEIMGNLTKDALADFLKEHQAEYDALDKNEQKIINRAINKASADLIKTRIYAI